MIPLRYVDAELDERQAVILRAVVEEHVSTSRPVASGSVARRSALGLSSATIRNEFSILEELHLIEQPHTSAGRVPSDRGYRVYVDDLMSLQAPGEAMRLQVQGGLAEPQGALRELLSKACRMLSDLSGYTALVMIPTLKRDTMRHLQIGSVDTDSLLVLFVTISGRTEHRLHRLADHQLTPQRLAALNRFLNDRLRGLSLRDIKALDAAAVLGEEFADPFAEQVLDLVRDTIPDDDSQEVLIEGVICLLAEPEFRSAAVARPVLEAVQESATAADLLSTLLESDRCQVVIGGEHRVEPMRQCSFVGARYEGPGAVAGALGVLGPRRMRYSETVPVVETLAEKLSGSVVHG
ncbi:MAG: heat-inducible transcription repressor HrcA [Armatimonadetes bacterium CG_4_10_14_3_um_filter_66_18]|nr:heat-inducible transcription repressor HrcA [Armatimonadota bacterium]OIP01092.1 MAG: heat-inducible transcription repressor HrcA [Armatimonadetes bacterium CG2_30_66_41]PIU92779.1 MAG: heat-inducible transcription repressor HrcA [Armatimonadetes bacterium CG06_land_8_20_14_3_00_66_21]PIX39820.1 MAG: heat-inducible transcription repressor HrcA [Armatimonadetes bacterium CG_4_8_14_3_um_filter_66_20]PIY53671.1 MAG: heat-inducible transcription repressor HrcA [Armatimonadetes bacterium CG_4_10_